MFQILNAGPSSGEWAVKSLLRGSCVGKECIDDVSKPECGFETSSIQSLPTQPPLNKNMYVRWLISHTCLISFEWAF